MKIVIPIAILLLFWSCKKAEDQTCFKGWGDDNTMVSVPLDQPIDSLFLEDNVILHLTQDTMNYAEVVGGSNVVKHIKFPINNKKLTIKDENKCNFLRSYKKKIHVYLHVKNLTYIYYSGGELIEMENQFVGGELRIIFKDGGGTVNANVDISYFSIEASGGAGNFNVSGKADFAYLKVQSNAFGDASSLLADKLLMFNNSSGDLFGRVKDGGELKAEIYYKGNNYIYGNPLVMDTIDDGEGQNIFN